MKISAQYVHTQSIVYSGLLVKTTSTTTCSHSEAIHNIFIYSQYVKCTPQFVVCSVQPQKPHNTYCDFSSWPPLTSYQYFSLDLVNTFIRLFVPNSHSDFLNSFDQMLSMAFNAIQFFCYLKFMSFDIIIKVLLTLPLTFESIIWLSRLNLWSVFRVFSLYF